MGNGNARPRVGHNSWTCGTCGHPKGSYIAENCRECYDAERAELGEARRNRPRRPAGRPWTPAEDDYLAERYAIEPVRLIAAALGRTDNAIALRASARRLPSYQQAGRISARADYLDRIERPVQAYVLGLLLADGYVTQLGQLCIALHEKDRAAVEFVRDQIAPAARLGSYVAHNEGSDAPMIRFLIQVPRLTAAAARLGVVPVKSAAIRWPAAVPDRLANSLMLGYFDGDGSLGHQRGRPRWTVTSGSYRFLTDAQGRLEALAGVRPGGPYKDGDKKVWSIVATGGPARVLDEWTHRDVPGMARKRL